MYAYSMAAAHEKLPHLRMDNWMVSNTQAGGEGWAWIDALDDPCLPPNDKVDSDYVDALALPHYIYIYIYHLYI